MSGAWRVPGTPACCGGSCGDDCGGGSDGQVRGSYDGGCSSSSIPGFCGLNEAIARSRWSEGADGEDAPMFELARPGAFASSPLRTQMLGSSATHRENVNSGNALDAARFDQAERREARGWKFPDKSPDGSATVDTSHPYPAFGQPWIFAPYDLLFLRAPHPCPPGKWWTSDNIICRCPGTGQIAHCDSSVVVGTPEFEGPPKVWCSAHSIAKLNKVLHPHLDLDFLTDEMISCLKSRGVTSDPKNARDPRNSKPNRGDQSTYGVDTTQPWDRAKVIWCKAIIMRQFGINERLDYTGAEGQAPMSISPFRRRKNPCSVGDQVVVAFFFEPSTVDIRGLGHMVNCTITSCVEPIGLFCTDHPREAGRQYEITIDGHGKISGSGLDGGYVVGVFEVGGTW